MEQTNLIIAEFLCTQSVRIAPDRLKVAVAVLYHRADDISLSALVYQILYEIICPVS